jgi:hypothetical protein
MKIELHTPLKNIKFSDETRKFWKEKILARFDVHHRYYSWFKREDKFPEWEKMISNGEKIGGLLKNIASFYRSEHGDFQYNDTPNIQSSSYLSVELLDLLKKDNIDITKILLDNLNYEPKDYNDWHIRDFFSIYLDYLNNRNEKIIDKINNKFIEILAEYKRFSHQSVDEEVANFFKLLEVTPNDKITHEWFLNTLDFFCTIKDEETRKLVNYCKFLNYDSQKKIHSYMKQNFPNHLEENFKYYPNLLESKIFSTKRLCQGCIDINLFLLIEQYGLTHKDGRHLSNIATHCLTVVASSEFMQLIGEDITITNIENKEHQSNVILYFSTDTYENLEKAEKILLTALKGVLEVSEKIRLTWSESYHGEDELSTNMDAKFVHQYYMYHNLNDTLDSNEVKPKRPKV